MVKLLVENQAQLNLKDEGEGETALFAALGGGHVRLVKYLIINGCRVNLKRRNGDTLLHLACAYGRFKIIAELVKAGAKVNILDSDKLPPIYYAVLYGHSKIVAYLMANGASTASRIKTLMRIASRNKDQKTLRILQKVEINGRR